MQFVRACYRFGTIIYFELSEDAMNVSLDGAGCDEELCCYLLVGEAFGEQLQHLSLTRGKGSEQRRLGGRVGALVWGLECPQQPSYVTKQSAVARLAGSLAPSIG